MTFLEISILYLAMGLPFGAHFFLKHRFEKFLSAKTIAATLVWIPYSIRLLQSLITKKLINREFDKKLDSVSVFQKNIERILLENRSDSFLFEFREVFERYTALTLNALDQNQLIGENKRELFRISNGNNIELSATCLNRINRKKLIKHQANSRKDFFNLVNSIPANKSTRESFAQNVRLIASCLDDSEMIDLIDQFMPGGAVTSISTIEDSERFARAA